MRWRRSFQQDHSYPPHLAVFDNTVGRLWRDGAPVGYVSFSLTQAVTHTGGALWWRSYFGPRDVVWYREVLYPDTPYERVDEGPLSAPTAENPFSASGPASVSHHGDHRMSRSRRSLVPHL
jgi:hypothetical protein